MCWLIIMFNKVPTYFYIHIFITLRCTVSIVIVNIICYRYHKLSYNTKRTLLQYLGTLFFSNLHSETKYNGIYLLITYTLIDLTPFI